MPKQPDLHEQAYDFSESLRDLLNRTITHGIPLHAVVFEERGVCLVGHQLSRTNLVPDPIPVTLGAKPRCYLQLRQTLRMNKAGWLEVTRSSYGVHLEDDFDSPCLFHYDYDREPKNDYPVAHFQVVGESRALATLLERAGMPQRALGRMHFPVGGKRYRPTLEDVIEFLIVEGLVEARTKWESAVQEHRAEYERRQLSAAVTNDPETAQKALDDLRDR